MKNNNFIKEINSYGFTPLKGDDFLYKKYKERNHINDLDRLIAKGFSDEKN